LGGAQSRKGKGTELKKRGSGSTRQRSGDALKEWKVKKKEAEKRKNQYRQQAREDISKWRRTQG